MNLEEQTGGTTRHELAPYRVTLMRDPESLASLYVEIAGKLKLIVSVRIEENKELDSAFELLICSKSAALEGAYRVYTNQLTRLVSDVALLHRYKKTRFVLTVNVIESTGEDALCHIVNALMLALMLSRVEMKYFPVAATCFVDEAGKLYTEEEAAQAQTSLTRVYLCKKLSNNNEIVSFSISGGHVHSAELDVILSHLIGSANAVGRKLLEFAHSLATN